MPINKLQVTDLGIEKNQDDKQLLTETSSFSLPQAQFQSSISLPLLPSLNSSSFYHELCSVLSGASL